ncbi:hypothetical protein, partial [Mycobacterium tuberculosis]|uniref:hypothetical protein n=1 Tax=Mycobacterium tuberculosis TaxID=1773 RepID=UPI001BDFAAEC
SPDDLTKETIDLVLGQLRFETDTPISNFYKKVVIGLYLRVGTSVKHHPNDLNEYLKAWQYWKGLVGSMI